MHTGAGDTQSVEVEGTVQYSTVQYSTVQRGRGQALLPHAAEAGVAARLQPLVQAGTKDAAVSG